MEFMNKTFTGSNLSFNACVGYNGYTDLLTYSLGYDEFVKLGIQNINNPNINIDFIVYPLVYNARHRIELFIKHQLLLILHIKRNILQLQDNQNIPGIHEISILWTKLKEEIDKFEPRYNEIISKIDEYIDDFAEIDDTGEVFRYPNKKNNDKHLANLAHVNLLSFKTRYLELTELFYDMKSFSLFIFEEYEQKTFAGNLVTGFLSREKIKELAKDLPQINEWANKEEFNKIKGQIITKYSISSKTLGQAINIIKSNREFSFSIGKELIIKEFSENNLVNFISIYDKYLIERNNEDYSVTHQKYLNIFKDKFSHTTIASISQIYEIGYFSLYPEEYEKGLKTKLKEDTDNLINDNLLGNGIVKEKLIKGLSILKQKTLLRLTKDK